MSHFITFIFGAILALCLVQFTSKQTSMYHEGVEDTYKEAYKIGLAVREIGKDDRIIYRFQETHKIGYED